MNEEKPDQDEALTLRDLARKPWTTPILTVAAIDDLTQGIANNTPYDGGGLFFS